ncbi:Xylulose kinase [subsurface metagenome]
MGTTESINFIGGGAKSDIWCQILADILERNINQMNEPDFGSVRGAAIIALVGLGIFKDFSEAIKLIKVKNSYKPNIDNKKIYDKLFSEYIKIYKRNKKMFKNLNV